MRLEFPPFTLFFSCLILFGCSPPFLNVKSNPVNRDSLASTFVGSPDPLQKNPPIGQQLIITWSLSSKVTLNRLQMVLSTFYYDDSRETFTYPICCKKGVMSHYLVGQDYVKKRGLRTYKVEIVDSKEGVIKVWKHILWFDPIDLEEIEISS